MPTAEPSISENPEPGVTSGRQISRAACTRIQAAIDTKRAGMNLGEWLSRAIRAQIQSDSQASRAPVPVRQPEADSQTALSDVERIAASFRDLAAAGVPVSKTHAARITRALVARLPQ
jgi:hypothetical protein